MKNAIVKGHHTFIDTGLSFEDKRIYKGFMFYGNEEFETFKGYFSKERHYVMRSHNEIKKTGKLEKYVGMVMQPCNKPLLWNWKQFYDYYKGSKTFEEIENEIAEMKKEYMEVV